MHHTKESRVPTFAKKSTMCCPPWSPAPRCAFYRGVKLRGVLHTAESNFSNFVIDRGGTWREDPGEAGAATPATPATPVWAGEEQEDGTAGAGRGAGEAGVEPRVREAAMTTGAAGEAADSRSTTKEIKQEIKKTSHIISVKILPGLYLYELLSLL